MRRDADIRARFRWWMPSLAAFAVSAGLFVYFTASNADAGWFHGGSAGWWAVTTAMHLPYLVILLFVVNRLWDHFCGR